MLVYSEFLIDKYTWKVNPTNDDEIKFNFKLKDKYQNYITTSVLSNNEITVLELQMMEKNIILFLMKKIKIIFSKTK